MLSPLSAGIGANIIEIPTLELGSLTHSWYRDIIHTSSDCIFFSICNLQAETSHTLCDRVFEVSDSKFYFLWAIFDIVLVKFYLYLSVFLAELAALQGANTDGAGSWRSLWDHEIFTSKSIVLRNIQQKEVHLVQPRCWLDLDREYILRWADYLARRA